MNMYRLLLCVLQLLIFFSLASSEDTLEELFSTDSEQLITLTNYSDFLVGGVINPLSGQPCLKQTDLIARGAESIPLTRIFIPRYTPLNEDAKLSHQSYGGWVYFPHTRLNLCQTGKGQITETSVAVVDSNGVALVYLLENGETHLKSDPWGICNGIGDLPSGRHDPRNTKIRLEDNKIIVNTP